MSNRALKIAAAFFCVVALCSLTDAKFSHSASPVEPICQQQKQANQDEELQPSALFVTPPREQSRGLALARTAISDKDYRTAVELLGEFLATQHPTDYLVPSLDDPWRYISQLESASQMLGQIPRRELDDYELRYGITAKQMLNEGIASGDYGLIAKVTQRFFHTAAGKRATLLIGHYFLDNGQPTAAAAQFRKLVNDPQAKQQFEPELSVLLATSMLRANQPELADEALKQLKRGDSQLAIRVNGQLKTLSLNEASPADSLAKWVGVSDTTTSVASGQPRNWTTFKGSPQRNGNTGIGFALPMERWSVPTCNDPEQEDAVRRLAQDRIAAGKLLLPAVQSLAIDQLLVFRSMNQLVGVNMINGERIWAYPDQPPPFNTTKNNPTADRFNRLAGTSYQSETFATQRMWQDHIHGQFTSDGRAIFAIDNTGVAAALDIQLISPRGQRQTSPLSGVNTNELISFDLSGPKNQNWRVGGASGGADPRLAGGFFLGSPLYLQGSLYCMVEQAEMISMVAISATDGTLQWSVPLAAIDLVAPIYRDRVRRLAGASPSYANGTLVCPLSAGGLVAIDISTRALRWAVQYPNFEPSRRRQARGLKTSIPYQVTSQDSSVTIAQGRVVVMPAESDRILCYDMANGKQLWSSGSDENPFGRAASDGRYVAGIRDNHILVIADDHIRAIQLIDGTEAWQTKLDKVGSVSGHGFFAKGHYFFPTANLQMVQLSVSSGKIVQSSKTNQVLGNLLPHRDQIVSLSSENLTCFLQVDSVRSRLASLAENSEAMESSEALSLKAQLLNYDNDNKGAVALAERAWQKDPSAANQALFHGFLLRLLNEDYNTAKSIAAKHETALLAQQPSAYAMAILSGLAAENQLKQAFDFVSRPDIARQLAQQIQQSKLVSSPESPNHRLRLDRILQHKFQGFELTPRPAQSQQHAKDLLTMFGPRALSERDCIELANDAIRYRDVGTAEKLLRRINTESSQEPDAELAAINLRLAIAAGKSERSVTLLRTLQANQNNEFWNPWANAVSSKTDFVEFAKAKMLESDPDIFSEVAEPKTSDEWAYGQVSTTISDFSKQQIRNRQNQRKLYEFSFASTLQSVFDSPAPRSVRIDSYSNQVSVLNSTGKVEGRVSLATSNRTISSSNRGRHSIAGDLMVVQAGYQLVGVSLNRARMGKTEPLWKKNLIDFGSSNRTAARSAYRTWTIPNLWGQADIQQVQNSPDRALSGNYAVDRRQQVFYRSGKRLYAADGFTGETLWQRTDANNSLIVADDRYVAAIRPHNVHQKRGQYEHVTILESDTGNKTNEFSIKQFQDHTLWKHQRLNLFFSKGTAHDQSMTHFDLSTQKSNWSRTFPRNTRAELLISNKAGQPNSILFVTPKGEVVYVDANTGETIRELQIAASRYLSMQVLRMANRDLLFLSKQIRPRLSAIPHSQMSPLFNGDIVCIDRKQNKLGWAGPVSVEQCSPIIYQNSQLPLLVLHRQLRLSSANRKARAQHFLIDVRDGRLTASCDTPGFTYQTITLQGDARTGKMSIDLGRKKIDIEIRQADLPPSAPALIDSKTSIQPSVIGSQK